MTARYAALLRAVNLGSSRQVRMADLRQVLESLGFSDVETYLQSGNVVFSADEGDRGALESQVESAISDRFGFHIPVILITSRKLKSIVSACPYISEAESDPAKVHVIFVDRMPAASALAGIDLDRVAPERFALGKRVIYMSLPLGMGRSNLSGLLAKATSGVVATTRNWRTVVSLDSMLGGPA